MPNTVLSTKNDLVFPNSPGIYGLLKTYPTWYLSSMWNCYIFLVPFPWLSLYFIFLIIFHFFSIPFGLLYYLFYLCQFINVHVPWDPLLICTLSWFNSISNTYPNIYCGSNFSWTSGSDIHPIAKFLQLQKPTGTSISAFQHWTLDLLLTPPSHPLQTRFFSVFPLSRNNTNTNPVAQAKNLVNAISYSSFSVITQQKVRHWILLPKYA